jgi:hypothetical protein
VQESRFSVRLGGPADASKSKEETARGDLETPELEHSKTAVLNSLPSLGSRRSYDHAIRVGALAPNKDWVSE